ncbi:MAG: hypothetical protein HFI03_14445 [Lachnospiraceae bacterium]|jgi:hypothetical protein|nr:hypothetical protein [Lachnospiraceae bacterium]
MAIQTIKATIQMRYGLEADLKPDQLVTGEWAVATDKKKIWMCFRPGLVLRMATYEAFEQDMREIQLILATCQDIQAAVERFMQLAQQHESQAEVWSVTSKSWAVGGTGTREGENTNNSKFWSQKAEEEADRAKMEADRAAAIAGIDIDLELNESSANPVQNRAITKELNKKLSKDGDASNVIVNFQQAEEREEILSGEKLSVILKKIKKWFADLKPVAFSGDYANLINKPKIPSVTNNLLATIPGTSLDAVQGKILSQKNEENKNNLFYENISRDKFKENLLLVSVSTEKHDANKTRLVLNPSTNSPVTGTFLGIWKCYWYDNAHLLVKVEECYPICGRIWTNFYNTSDWGGWKSITPQ